MLVPQPGIKPVPPALGSPSLNHQSAREVCGNLPVSHTTRELNVWTETLTWIFNLFTYFIWLWCKIHSLNRFLSVHCSCWRNAVHQASRKNSSCTTETLCLLTSNFPFVPSPPPSLTTTILVSNSVSLTILGSSFIWVGSCSICLSVTGLFCLACL